MVKIAACFITKGDEELASLKTAVSSVFLYVDSINILANSKEVDKTQKWCKDHGYNYSYLPWNKDFSEQRNFNFAMAPKDVDYIFWMDSDDYLVGGERLRDIAETAKQQELDCLYLDYWYSSIFRGKPSIDNLERVEIRHMRERLINPRKMMWKKRIHECPIEFQGVKLKHSQYKKDDCAVLHLGSHRNESKETADKRLIRNREILELELEDERKSGSPDPRTILYLMKIYLDLLDPKLLAKNIEYGKEYLELSGWNLERGGCLVLMGRSAQELGRLNEALGYFYRSIEEYPFSNNARIRLAHCLCDLNKFEEADLYIKQALNNEGRDSSDGVENIIENEMISTDVLIKLHWLWEKNRNIRKTFKFAEKLYELHPVKKNYEYMEQMRSLANLDVACEHADKLMKYLEKQGDEKAVLDILQTLPSGIKQQPFAINTWKRLSNPKIWGKNEIAYFCGNGLEFWDGDSLKNGIGGSETAVIELSRQWVKNGYSVTVYGNPEEMKTIDGVKYVPHYYFNQKDKFNVLIEWRNTYWADKVSAKKYYVDFHDVVSPSMVLSKLDHIDAIMVKSQAHRNLLFGVPDGKIKIISNGVS